MKSQTHIPAGTPFVHLHFLPRPFFMPFSSLFDFSQKIRLSLPGEWFYSVTLSPRIGRQMMPSEPRWHRVPGDFKLAIPPAERLQKVVPGRNGSWTSGFTALESVASSLVWALQWCPCPLLWASLILLAGRVGCSLLAALPYLVFPELRHLDFQPGNATFCLLEDGAAVVSHVPMASSVCHCKGHSLWARDVSHMGTIETERHLPGDKTWQMSSCSRITLSVGKCWVLWPLGEKFRSFRLVEFRNLRLIC